MDDLADIFQTRHVRWLEAESNVPLATLKPRFWPKCESGPRLSLPLPHSNVEKWRMRRRKHFDVAQERAPETGRGGYKRRREN